MLNAVDYMIGDDCGYIVSFVFDCKFCGYGVCEMKDFITLDYLMSGFGK